MSTDLKESSAPLAEISQGPNAFEAFLDRNQKGIAALAVLLVIGAIGAVIYRGIEHSRKETAGADLSKAGDLAAFQAVVDGHGGTAAAASAMILLANSQWADGKKDDSISTLRKFIESNPKHPALASAKASLSSKLIAQGKSGDASRVLEELVSDPTARFIAPFALISLGDIAKSTGDLDKARKTYEQAKEKFPESNFLETANNRISTLDAKPPVGIDPPPAPAPAPAPTPAPVNPAVAPSAPLVPTPEPLPSEQAPATPPQ